MPYCTKEDLLLGDLRLPARVGDGSSFVQSAADEIDAQIGHIYVTPITFPALEDPAHRPAKLLLKKINSFLGSARILMDTALGGEDTVTNALGRSYLREATNLLVQIQNGDIILNGAEKVEGETEALNNAVSIRQEDPYSLVENFYGKYSRPYGGYPYNPARPYDDRTI